MKPVLRRLLTDYLAEFSVMESSHVLRDADDQIPYRYFDQYWSEPTRFPFCIAVDSEIAGFCLLRDSGQRWEVAEFYVVPAHRRNGFGAAAVASVKAFCRESGRYATIEASALRVNHRALAFWRSQGFVTVGETAERLINVCDLAQEARFELVTRT